jgi:hypothetical protein
VKSFKLVGEEPSWTNQEAEAVKGQSVSFAKGKFIVGFPGQIALPEPGQGVALGDGVSFCLGKK